jgi:hypothetical protein
MFDRTTIHKTESKVVAVTKEIEKTITPDKVTEMYDAVRDEVEKSIIRCVVIADNSLNGSAIEMEERYDTSTHVILLRLTLNGSEHISRETLEREALMNEAKLYERLRDFYVRTVADEVMRRTIDIIPKSIPLGVAHRAAPKTGH